MVKKRIVPKKNSKGRVHCFVDPDFYNLMEEYRKKFEKKGIRDVGHTKVTKAIHDDLRRSRGLINAKKYKKK